MSQKSIRTGHPASMHNLCATCSTLCDMSCQYRQALTRTLVLRYKFLSRVYGSERTETAGNADKSSYSVLKQSCQIFILLCLSEYVAERKRGPSREPGGSPQLPSKLHARCHLRHLCACMPSSLSPRYVLFRLRFTDSPGELRAVECAKTTRLHFVLIPPTLSSLDDSIYSDLENSIK
jgi:hypothetical protein